MYRKNRLNKFVIIRTFISLLWFSGVVLIFGFFSSCKQRSESQLKVIFGEDDRRNPFELADKSLVPLFSSLAAFMPKSAFSCGGRACAQEFLEVFTLEQEIKTSFNKNLCPNEKFGKESSDAFCSGALVAPNIVATAAHCLEERPLDETLLVFGWNYSSADLIGKHHFLRSDQIYQPIKILSINKDVDFAFLQLDRNVTMLKPVTVNSTLKNVQSGDGIFGLGHPKGLPGKISLNGIIREIESHTITSNLDTFPGMSGGPVFSEVEKEMIGIHKKGAFQQNFYYDLEKNCMATIKFKENDQDVSSGFTRIDFALKHSFKEVRDAIAGSKLIVPDPSTDIRLRKGQKLVIKQSEEAVSSYAQPDFSDAIDLELGEEITLLEPEFSIHRVEGYSSAFVFVQITLGEKGTRFISSLDIDWKASFL